MNMTPDELLILKHGREKIDKAKEIAGHCPTGYFVFLNRADGGVFYKDAHSGKHISTDFTKEQFDVYTVKGK